MKGRSITTIICCVLMLVGIISCDAKESTLPTQTTLEGIPLAISFANLEAPRHLTIADPKYDRGKITALFDIEGQKIIVQIYGELGNVMAAHALLQEAMNTKTKIKIAGGYYKDIYRDLDESDLKNMENWFDIKIIESGTHSIQFP